MRINLNNNIQVERKALVWEDNTNKMHLTLLSSALLNQCAVSVSVFLVVNQSDGQNNGSCRVTSLITSEVNSCLILKQVFFKITLACISILICIY